MPNSLQNNNNTQITSRGKLRNVKDYSNDPNCFRKRKKVESYEPATSPYQEYVVEQWYIDDPVVHENTNRIKSRGEAVSRFFLQLTGPAVPEIIYSQVENAHALLASADATHSEILDCLENESDRDILKRFFLILLSEIRCAGNQITTTRRVFAALTQFCPHLNSYVTSERAAKELGCAKQPFSRLTQRLISRVTKRMKIIMAAEETRGVTAHFMWKGL